MGMDLRGALVKAGMATEAQAREAEKVAAEKKAKETAKAEQGERIERYPRNRFGKPVAFADWYFKKVLPKDAQRRCFHCGEAGLDLLDALGEVFEAQDRKLVEDESATFLDAMNAGVARAAEIGQKGQMLKDMSLSLAFANPGAARWFEAKGVKPVICNACVKFFLAKTMGEEFTNKAVPAIPKEVYDPKHTLSK